MGGNGRTQHSRISRRDAAWAMAAMGMGFVVLGVRPRPPAVKIAPVQFYGWNAVTSWTLRLPAFPRPLGEIGVSADQCSSMLDHLPVHPRISWSVDGVRTSDPRSEIVRTLRGQITDDFSHGRIELTAGWGLAKTEWILLQLAAGPPRLTADAARP